jgi:hypothetical protein
MSYLLYINGLEVEISSLNIAQTKQVNDIANITNRNSNFTQSIKIPKTANNTFVMRQAGLVGNKSNVPYIKNECDLIDADTGEHFIYKGWAVLIETTDKEYNLTIYDGSIDFYRAIENITITQCGISDLNHVKSLSNVISTWNEVKPYKYLLADYNGNNFFNDRINIDYQVPSASIPYIWERIFDFIGYEYEGSVFTHEDFQNAWLTFPKPTGELEPNRILINEQTTDNQYYVINFISSGNLSGSFTTINSDVWRFNFIETTAQNTTTGQVTTTTAPVSTVPVRSYVEILETGTYSIDFENAEGLFFMISVRNALNELLFLETFQNGYVFNATIGDKVYCSITPDPALGINAEWVVAGGGGTIGLPIIGVNPPDMSEIVVKFSRVDGYAVNFDEIFIDFKVSDFIKEILIRFGLTPFKDKYTNKVRFLTLYELLQNQDIDNYSDKFINKTSEKYSFGGYAKRNNFKYKYNDDASNHNNGYIEIENENLAEEKTIIQSLIYSPELKQSDFLVNSNVYKIWDKQIKDDNTIEYKDLENRFYFQREEKVIGTVLLISELTSDIAQSGNYSRESYFRLSYQSIIFDWYRPIQAIFDKAKLVTANFWLKAVEVASLDLSKLIYVEQLSSYFLINKVNNFVKGKPTKLELIEVDYLSQPDVTIPIVDELYLFITDYEVVDCELILTVDTNLPQPFSTDLIVFNLGFVSGVPTWTETIQIPNIEVTVDSDTAIVPLDTFELYPFGYKFGFRKNIAFNAPLVSNLTEPIILDGSCFIGTPVVGSTLTITNAVAIAVNGFQRTLRVYFTSDFVGAWNFTIYVGNFGVVYQQTTFSLVPNGFVDIEIQHPTGGGTSFCNMTAQNGVTSNSYSYTT